jgi:murein DD-endopeptidase MepM/ murein hydrolase activator NlpD
VRVLVRPPANDSVSAVSGELAGEPLHFERFADGFAALGAVPFGAEDSAAARVVIEHADSTSDTAIVALPVGRRHVPRERLHVAPEFAEPPDSLTERIRLEQELVQGVRQRAHETPRLWRVPFVRPRSSAVTSGFGVARVFNKVLRSRHWGVDFAGQLGAPVRAANRGVVALVADLYYSGTTILIDHGAGLVTGYFHLSRVLVVPGDTVDVGQLIGRVGSSGRVTRSHLHWFAAYGGITVDPLDLVRPNGPARLPAP